MVPTIGQSGKGGASETVDRSVAARGGRRGEHTGAGLQGGRGTRGVGSPGEGGAGAHGAWGLQGREAAHRSGGLQGGELLCVRHIVINQSKPTGHTRPRVNPGR